MPALVSVSSTLTALLSASSRRKSLSGSLSRPPAVALSITARMAVCWWASRSRYSAGLAVPWLT